MNKFRMLIKSVNKYVDILHYNNQDAKKNASKYLDDIRIIRNSLNSYKNQASIQFDNACAKNMEIWSMNNGSILLSFKNFFNMFRINQTINKLSKELSYCKILQKNLNILETRFTQYATLLQSQ